jgi:hypothetical protein
VQVCQLSAECFRPAVSSVSPLLIKRAGISALDFNYEQRAYQCTNFLKKEFYSFIFNNLYMYPKRQGKDSGRWRIRTTANEPVRIRKADKGGGKVTAA